MLSVKYFYFHFWITTQDNSKYIYLASVLEIILTQQKEKYEIKYSFASLSLEVLWIESKDFVVFPSAWNSIAKAGT